MATNVETTQDATAQEKFSSYTTLHGFQFTVSGNHPFRRCVWILTMIFMFCILSYHLFSSFYRFSQYETTYTSNSRFKSSLKFPAVTICNMNMMKKSKILGKDAQAYLESINGIIPQHQKVRFVNDSFDLEKEVLENGHQIKDMLVKCLWEREFCSHENFTLSLSFTRGLCYTFNSGETGHRLLSVTGNGRQYGLTITLNPELNEYFGQFSYQGVGVIVAVHEQGDIPDIDLFGTVASARFAVTMSAKKSIIKRLGKPYSDHGECIKTEGYSSSVCLASCKLKVLIDMCGCKLTLRGFDEEKFSKIPKCNLADEKTLKCIHQWYMVQRNRDCQGCPHHCTQVTYSVSKAVSTFPSDHFWEDVRKYQSSNPVLKATFGKHLHSNKSTPLVRIEVFYETLGVQSVYQLPAYSFDDLLGDIGGFLGLFFGCSLLTLGEFLELLVMWCLNRRKSNRVIMVKPQN